MSGDFSSGNQIKANAAELLMIDQSFFMTVEAITGDVHYTPTCVIQKNGNHTRLSK
jgi:hypothetical protein